ncbi:MAG: hypothetical protein CO042_02910 [Parcubacteria group bacterium CG_4_9_14_0_2_um_filter_41_8]|nr:MAG: hypothetical protein AUJ34_01915 [Parcubacteria group bacterium CG1_02_41_12]PIP67022.1 MAG: hypothetical protein COW93_02510 [Parcubacteria group bacterium CG22_combo_CG10-13_8_21_14_all_41_9]PIQ79930.1 MAG: hypothetical protein COV79_02815 [Parcubacteria group bacterium CG11_big_fil_rev_8_21_14_0_20_41_14]PIR57425.1 MAG: hypothetical protein COU72_00985 [Parcubacteria group bacterium CG10_big_fil_rev_8_21_14_0_10_41_35]PIZ81461.1 MAG: hypothetical protein COY02_01910 [Parcubacteria gr
MDSLNILEIMGTIVITAIVVVVMRVVFKKGKTTLSQVRQDDTGFRLKMRKFCKLLLLCNVIGILALVAVLSNPPVSAFYDPLDVIFSIPVVSLVIISFIASLVSAIIVFLKYIEGTKLLAVINFALIFFLAFPMFLLYLFVSTFSFPFS